MTIRAVIFDVYKTLLAVEPPPADREARWQRLAREVLGAPPRLGLGEFVAAVERVIAREHAAARAAGIAFPEVYWPAVAGEVLPELGAVGEAARVDFLFRQQALMHRVNLMAGAAAVLGRLRAGGVVLGIASNAQPYTLRELDEALATAGLGLDIFERELRFWSFAHGFSKPDPHVFRLLSARLRARGVSAGETLMVGDRADNDIEPARAQGWQTWRLTSAPGPHGEGDWETLGAWLDRQV